ncbi:putative polygalacturonase [Medicago truncatula]|uniref:Polygalacturonase QRT3-like protein n=1 Tax=Medicago truncatula TaxID=3880 RepID=A0A072UPZ7_MEDTR|nr:polygalacturonase QRT3 [Medicago truncatula]KEH31416.1 polygalacturonase QRT3-like protein [Medicago truncatula]RHN62921.1 putative polygalacturonase [Medicago truncatula]
MRFSVVYFVLLLVLLVKAATCFTFFTREQKLSEFKHKLEQQQASPLASPPISSQTKMSNRVLYPSEYGADPTGSEESSDAILKVVEDAFKLQKGLQLVAGVNDLGGVIIDLQGGDYKISKPITLLPGGNIVVKGGTLRASDTFPGDRHLVEMWSSNSKKLQTKEYMQGGNFSGIYAQNNGIYYEDVTFRDILFDSRYRGGGLFIVDSARTRINNCFFLHFTTEGILVQQGHETFISSCFLGQHSTVGGDHGEKDYSGVGIDLASNDNAITDVAIFSAATGIVLRGQANILSGVHCYNKAAGFGGIGILVKLAGNSLTRIDNCYMDYTGIVTEDPVQVHVTNCLFLGDANILIKAAEGQILGLNIVDNMFNGDPNKKVPIVSLEGQFSNVDQVVIDRNNVNGMGLRSTVGKLTVSGNGTKWEADFSSVLVFPNRISHVQYSFYAQGEPKFVAHSVTNVSDNVVVVESEKEAKGLVHFSVEQ